MLENLWNNILDWFEDRRERSSLIRSFNSSAKNAFISGVAPTLLKAKISKGNREYRHQFSNWRNTGFRIQAFAGRQLSKNELIKIAEVILSDEILVRRLIVLGWDTLEVHTDEGNYGVRFQLKDRLSLPKF